jgi:nitrile hydratase subunit beta
MTLPERPPKFHKGDRIVVRRRDVEGHIRTPRYVQGRPGVVVAYRGIWPNPELLAYRVDDPTGVALFTVDFDLTDLWQDYAHDAGDRVAVDLYEHWLEAR